MKPENMQPYSFKNTLSIQIRFDDIDGMGHVNNTVLMSYFDYGKWKYIEAVNSNLEPSQKAIPILAHYEVDFFEPVFINDQISVQTKVIDFGNKSMQMIQRIVAENGKVKCICKSIMVGFDKETNTALAIPEAFKKVSEKMEA